MQPVLTREQSNYNDNEQSTAQTVARMAQHVAGSKGDPAVVWAAHQALNSAGGPGASRSARCKAVFYWIKSHVRFRTDDALIAQLFGEQDQLELLISPPVLLRAAKPAGDCDDFTMLCCAMLNELGVPCQIVTVKADQPDPDRWSHVYCDAGGMVLDCSHGDFPGWEVPHYYSKRYWDSGTGQALATVPGSVPQHPIPAPFRMGTPRAAGLHGLTRRGTPFRRGLGDDTGLDELPISSTPIDTTIPNFDPGTGAVIQPITNTNLGPTGNVPSSCPQGVDLFTGQCVATQTGASSFPSISSQGLSQILSSGAATLQLALSPAGSVLVRNADGSYSVQTPNQLGLTSSSMTSLLWIGGAVVGVVLLASVLKK